MNIFDQRIRWRAKAYEDIESVCRVRIINSDEIGPVALILNVRENQGPGVGRALNDLMPELLDLESVHTFGVHGDFDSVLWLFGQPTACGMYLSRIREAKKGYQIDRLLPLPLSAFEVLKSWPEFQSMFDIEDPDDD